MVATWIAISAASSCRCRLYTAVSRDDLPSLYRTWTARKFLNQVKPSIDRVQGVVDAGWAETERSNAGPAVPPLAAVESPARAAGRSHTLASDLFVLSLFVCALVDLSVAQLHAAIWPKVTTGLGVAQLVGAIAVMAQHYRGLLGSAMNKLAIAALVLMGLMLYVEAFSVSFTTFATGGGMRPVAVPMPMSPAFMVAVHRVADGLDLLLGFIGAAIILRGGEPASQ
jgi:hypothetical protein